jgi:SAM-dependent methyltransferase
MSWYNDVFAGKYDLFTFHFFTEERNRFDAHFISKALYLDEGDKVLDSACGYGRHARLLAKIGIDVTGIDFSERYIKMAKSQTNGLPLKYYLSDLRELDFHEQFDAAYSFFTSFGYFDDNTNFDILQRISRSLKPGGRFLLDLQNRELFSTGEPEYQEFTEIEVEGSECTLLMTCFLDVDTSRVSIEQKLYGLPEGPQEMTFDVRIYTAGELRWLFHKAGMEITKIYGDTDGSAYDMTSQRCIAVGQKV